MKIPCLKTLLIPRIRTLLKLVQGGLVIGFKRLLQNLARKKLLGGQGGRSWVWKSWKWGGSLSFSPSGCGLCLLLPAGVWVTAVFCLHPGSSSVHLSACMWLCRAAPNGSATSAKWSDNFRAHHSLILCLWVQSLKRELNWFCPWSGILLWSISCGQGSWAMRNVYGLLAHS